MKEIIIIIMMITTATKTNNSLQFSYRCEIPAPGAVGGVIIGILESF